MSARMIGIPEAIASLDAYLNSWRDPAGGVHGYIIHHHRDYAAITAPACWTQGVRVIGHLELYHKTHDERWLGDAHLESTYLVGAYSPRVHLYHDSTTPLTLINNAWPTLALLRTAAALRSAGKDGWRTLLEVAGDNLRERMIAEHWDGPKGTFFFCPMEYPSKRVHTYNQTAIAISVLCAMSQLAGEQDLISGYAIPAADHMIQMQEKTGPLKGGWGYNDGESAHLYYYLYTALNCRGLLDLYEHTREDRFLESAKLAGDHLVGMIDPRTKLFSHRYVKAKRGVKRFAYPTMVAASGLGFQQIRRLQRHGFSYDVDEDIRALLGMQLPHGGFPNFIGASDIWTPQLYPCEPEKRKWRDVVSVPFWNVFTFELLVDLLEEGEQVPEPVVRFPLATVADDGYTVEEDVDYVGLLRTDNARTVAYFEKKRDFMLFSTEKMRGVPFGAFANAEHATILKLKRRVKIMAAAGLIGLLGAVAILASVLL